MAQRLNASDPYSEGESRQDSCEDPRPVTLHHLRASWLLTAAAFNAGDEIVVGLEKYEPQEWENLRPEEFIRTIDFVPATGEFSGKNKFSKKFVSEPCAKREEGVGNYKLSL
jgi:hypothetical protein